VSSFRLAAILTLAASLLTDPTAVSRAQDVVPVQGHLYISGRLSESLFLELEAEHFNGPPVGWTARIDFEAYCIYRDADTNLVMSTLTSDDIGWPIATVTLEGDDLPRYGVATATSTSSGSRSDFEPNPPRQVSCHPIGVEVRLGSSPAVSEIADGWTIQIKVQ
jgi:hypothetical protein